MRDATSNEIPKPTPFMHLNVRVAQTLQLLSASIGVSFSSRVPKVAPKSLLLVLGVGLPDIAYSSSFESLLEPQDYEVCSDSRLVGFYAAQRLASNVVMFLGAGFTTIIRQVFALWLRIWRESW